MGVSNTIYHAHVGHPPHHQGHTGGHGHHSHTYHPSSGSAYNHRFLQVSNSNPNSLRRRVQSPNRRDFKDFSSSSNSSANRDFMRNSPMKHLSYGHRSAYLDEDDDSGADSLGNDLGYGQ